MFWESLGEALIHILSAPFRDLSVLWQLIPIFLMWLLLEAYFVRWNESLGWNSALANSVTLFWISTNSMQLLFSNGFSWPHFIIFLGSIIYAFFIAFITFKHRIRERFAFAIASPVFIHYWCLFLILWAHKLIDMTAMVVLGVIILFIVFLIIDFFLKFLLREEKEFEHSLQDQFQHFSEQHPTNAPANIQQNSPPQRMNPATANRVNRQRGPRNPRMNSGFQRRR